MRDRCKDAISGEAFVYRVIGQTYVLYSIYPGGKDGGGHTIDTGASRATNPDERCFVKLTSRGDIVAGKNVW